MRGKLYHAARSCLLKISIQVNKLVEKGFESNAGQITTVIAGHFFYGVFGLIWQIKGQYQERIIFVTGKQLLFS